MADVRTEREKLMEALHLHADKPTPCREPEPGRPMDPCPVAYPDDPKAWCRDCLVLAAADLLSEEGEPVAWLVEKHDGGWLLQRDVTLYARSGFSTGRVRPLYPGPVQEASDER